MKKTILYALILSMLFVGCNTGITPNNKQEREIVTSQGLKVILKEGIPSKVMDYTIDDYKSLIISKTRAISNINPELSNLSLDDLSHYINIVDKTNNYPDLSLNCENEKEKTMSIIKADFPELTDSEIQENIDTIINIYEQQQRYELFNLLESDTNQRGILDTVYSNYSLTSEEFWCLFWNPTKIIGTKDATEIATSYQNNKFPNMNGHNTYSDAFRHSLWNALICIHVGGTKSSRIEWAEKFTTLHETSSGSYDANGLETNMDLHNNMIGRNWYDKNATQSNYWIFYSVSSPSDELAANAIYNLAKNSVYCTNVSSIKSNSTKLVHIK